MKAPSEADVAKIIARLKPQYEYLAPILAKNFVARLDHGYMPVLRATDRKPIEKAHDAAAKLLAQLHDLSPHALEAVTGCFLSQRNADGLSSDPEAFKGQITALLEALADTGREIKTRKLRTDTNTRGIAVALAAWYAWDEGDSEGRSKGMPEGLRDGAPFIGFLGDLLGVCGIDPEKSVTVYRAALEYLKNHR
ncbi:MAG: hypothetical protein K9G43_14670 [Rhodobacteraceae bacterium]|nr:hypothetical protein [Paracoccaceae bacterium]